MVIIYAFIALFIMILIIYEENEWFIKKVLISIQIRFSVRKERG